MAHERTGGKLSALSPEAGAARGQTAKVEAAASVPRPPTGAWILPSLSHSPVPVGLGRAERDDPGKTEGWGRQSKLGGVSGIAAPPLSSSASPSHQSAPSELWRVLRAKILLC
ncbi:UNVERIFIED_CONTAM: hypothetical protein K2H54_031086 [Gekko kuhli]